MLLVYHLVCVLFWHQVKAIEGERQNNGVLYCYKMLHPDKNCQHKKKRAWKTYIVTIETPANVMKSTFRVKIIKLVVVYDSHLP
mgnify:CR=1 FL=1